MKLIPAQELTLGDAAQTKLSWWVESVTIDLPIKSDGSSSKALLPRECRERGLVYGAPMIANFKYKVGDSEEIRLQVRFLR